MSPPASPYLGPETGDVLDARDLAELERMAAEHAAKAITQAFPVYAGPRTGETAVLEPIAKEGSPLEQLRQGKHGSRNRGRRRHARPALAPGRGRGDRRRDRAGDQDPLAAGQGTVGQVACRAERSSVALVLAATVAVVACAAWALRRAYSVEAAVAGHGNRLSFIFTLAFIALVWQMILCNLERPYKVTAVQAGELRRLRTLVHVPVYNEDAAYLGQCLESVFRQTWLPGFVSVTDDGSAVDYSAAEARFREAAAAAGVPVEWVRTPNQGKRHAQGVAVRGHPEADVFITVDSDTTLDPRAIEEGLKPLADPRVHSVAGMILPRNSQKNFLTRVIDMWWTPSQLVDRSSLSAMGAVLVNSGVLAFYRGGLMRDNLDGYLNETFFGRPVEFSDDSILTMYALERGRAVQQPTAFAFTAMPENMSHHARQYVRWMRGAMIRSFWRFRYLRASGYAFWAHVIGWVQWVLATCVFWTLFVVEPAVTRRPDWALMAVPVLIAYGQGLRYFTVRRSDQSRWSQLATYLLTPVTALWVFFGLRVIRWYGMATCLKTGWGTRKKIEVSL